MSNRCLIGRKIFTKTVAKWNISTTHAVSCLLACASSYTLPAGWCISEMPISHVAQIRRWVDSSRYSALLVLLLFYLIFCSLTRIALTLANISQVKDSPGSLLPAFLVGVGFDLVASLWLLLGFSLFLLVMRDRWMTKRFVRWLSQFLLFGFIYGTLYLSVVEYFFFSEFSARFNTVAVDYLIYPHEVFVNLWDTYPVWQALLAVFVLAAILFIPLRRLFAERLTIPTPWKRRFLPFAVHALLLAVSLLVWNINLSRISANRVVNELSLNGLYSFASAARTSELDYQEFYAMLPDTTEAFARVRKRLSSDGSSFVDSTNTLSLELRIQSNTPARPLNVVIVLEESFGSKFIRSLDSTGPGVATEFERLADSGLLFTNIYATGNRTVRGMEALLASFPPLPPEAIVRRPGGHHVFTLSSLLKSRGYSTAFIYGGFSYFDNMGDFVSSNGFDRVFDRTEFPQKTFSTIWGVCDEDLFDNSLRILDSLHGQGRPFFSLLLTVSNHSPYTYPEGRIETTGKRFTRENAVRYADYSLGKFLHDAATHPFFDSTLFIVVADHGARVYGSQRIPMASYRIPLLFYAPRIIAAGQRNDVLGCQLDVPATIMGILGGGYTSEFFGENLLSSDSSRSVALSHNRDIGLMTRDELAVLGLEGQVELLKRDSADGNYTEVKPSEDTAFVQDAIAYFQVAYFLYSHHLLKPPDSIPSLLAKSGH